MKRFQIDGPGPFAVTGGIEVTIVNSTYKGVTMLLMW